MNRVRAVLLAFAGAGGVGAAAVMSEDTFVVGFFFVFWGGISAVITWIASRTWAPADEGADDRQDAVPAESRPFFDETGVHRFQGDVLDVENHPTAGAQGRN